MCSKQVLTFTITVNMHSQCVQPQHTSTATRVGRTNLLKWVQTLVTVCV